MKFCRILVIGTIAFLLSQPGLAQEDKPAPVEKPAVTEKPVQAAVPATTGAPNLELTKKCPSLRFVGRDAAFELTVTNRGTGPALNVVVTDTLPNTVEFLNANNNGQREGQNVVWRIGTLEAGQSRALQINVRCNQITMVRNAAKVTYCAEAQAACEFPVKGIPAILLECVDDPDPIEIGGQMTYTITVTNQGTETGTKIVVECTLPDEEEFVKTGGATEGKADGKTVKFAPLATLAPKAKAVFTVTVKGVKEGDARFRVNLSSEQIETPVMETESTHIY